MTTRLDPPRLLRDARVYLSGPMDFVASRTQEQATGWRNRVGDFLRKLGATVFDPWNKPDVRGLHEYGREDDIAALRKDWTFGRQTPDVRARAKAAAKFWPVLHVDLRMVDTSDFVIAFCPTNIYSVGTVHEVVLCRQQQKPALIVSPPIDFPVLSELRAHLEHSGDLRGARLLEELENSVPIKPNRNGCPSLWYLPLVGAESFFDGFGFAKYRKLFRWSPIPLDDQERLHPPKRPLLPFLLKVNKSLPTRWSTTLRRRVPNDDWILWELKNAQLSDFHQAHRQDDDE